MTREEHYQKILQLSKENKYLMLRLPTSFGKSKIAIDIIKENSLSLFSNILIVIPRLVLIDNWKDELKKWGFPDYVNITFTTYVSFFKYANGTYDFVIFDECHHFTDRCLEAMEEPHFAHVIALSATIPKEARWRLKDGFYGIKEYSVSAREAIEESILPDPRVLLVPMMLDNRVIDETIVKQKSKSGQPVVLSYRERFVARSIKNRPIHIRCTQQEWYNYNSEMIEWWKNQYISSQQVYQKNNWLRLCKDRLNWCAEKKEPFVLKILDILKGYRTLTFCTSVDQTEKLGQYCINSKNKEALKYLQDFNEGNVDHITACNMLNEGMNLVDCQIGIYANIGSSEIVEAQRLGRLLRHPEPLIIIPYFGGTREEEIVKKMLGNYNPELIIKLFPYEVTSEKLIKIIHGTEENNN